MRFNRENWWAENVSADNIPWDEDLNGGLSGSMATAEAFNTLINVFAIPSSSGSTVYHQVYGYNQKTDRYEPSTNYNYNDMQRRFVLEEDYGKFAGRPMYGGYQFGADDINYTSGGAIYDRLNAFIALTDPRVDFLSIEEYSDARKYLISFFTFFPEKMISVLGGLTTQRYSNYASCVVEDNAGNPTYLRLRDVRNADDPDFCKDGHYLYPEETDYDFVTTWYRIPMLAAYFGMALMINNYDRRFMDATRIFIKGHGDEITLPVDAEVIEFLDPMTGKNYMAYKAGEDNVTDIAWYLVNRCATVASGMLVQYNIEFTKMLEKEEVTEDQRSAWLKEQFQNEYAEGVGELQRMVALLELLRGMHKVYDYSSYGSMAFDLDP